MTKRNHVHLSNEVPDNNLLERAVSVLSHDCC